MTTPLYPSWIEIPVLDLARARTFYREVFGLAHTPNHEETGLQIVVLCASNKAEGRPGVSLVQSPHYRPCRYGVLVNFHIGDHGALEAALERVISQGGQVPGPVSVTEDGIRYVTVVDSEGNSFALSSYEP